MRKGSSCVASRPRHVEAPYRACPSVGTRKYTPGRPVQANKLDHRLLRIFSKARTYVNVILHSLQECRRRSLCWLRLRWPAVVSFKSPADITASVNHFYGGSKGTSLIAWVCGSTTTRRCCRKPTTFTGRSFVFPPRREEAWVFDLVQPWYCSQRWKHGMMIISPPSTRPKSSSYLPSSGSGGMNVLSRNSGRIVLVCRWGQIASHSFMFGQAYRLRLFNHYTIT